MALAPIAGTHVLSPFGIMVVHMLGNIVVRADRFETAPSAATTGQSNQPRITPILTAARAA